MLVSKEFKQLEIGVKQLEIGVGALTVKSHKFWALLCSSHDEMDIKEH